MLDQDAQVGGGARAAVGLLRRARQGHGTWRPCCCGPERDERLKAAFELAPRNPRVLYLVAMDGLARSKPGSPEVSGRSRTLQQAAQLFEQSSATRDDVPGWGHAEAYLALGMQLRRAAICSARATGSRSP